jgi:trans-aconitate methyltransferase
MSTSKQSNILREVANTKAYYETYGGLWSATKTNSFHHESQFRKFLTHLPSKASIIDIGCANGIHVPLFLGIGRNLRYTGMDIAHSFLKIASQRYPQLKFIEGDVSRKDTLPKKKFDGFFAVAVLMHIPFEQWDLMFFNIESISKRNAIGYITLPIERPNEECATDRRHFVTMTQKKYSAYIKSRGWKILNSGTLNGSSKKAIWKWYIVTLP